MASVQHRALSSLPTTSLPWLQLKDHFVQTVGPNAGQGKTLGPLLVLADATFAPRSRFPMHPHRDMEILSIVLEGDMSHHGDGANGQVVKPRGAQLISSRDGMFHAEGNDTDAPVHMLQIWFQPTEMGGQPQYFYRQLPDAPGSYVMAGDEGMPLRCAVKVSWLDVEGTVKRSAKQAYVMSLKGALEVGASKLQAGEGAMVSGGEVELKGKGAALWIDVG